MNTAQINENSYIMTWGDLDFFEYPENRKAFREAREPVFESLNPSFWLEHFGDKELPELRETIKALGIRSGFAKYQMVSALVRYFSNLVSQPDRK